MKITGGDESSPRTIGVVRKCIPFPKDRFPKHDDDIKIIVLKKSIQFNSMVNKIEIFPNIVQYLDTLDNSKQSYFTTGWGRALRAS